MQIIHCGCVSVVSDDDENPVKAGQIFKYTILTIKSQS